jgi:catechol 2,3-dioxygenase-like lactoylglutathione lyase family enzyme
MGAPAPRQLRGVILMSRNAGRFVLRSLLLALVSMVAMPTFLHSQSAVPVRPAITGVDHVAILVSNQGDAEKFYVQLLGLPRVSLSGDVAYSYAVNPTQSIETLTGPEKHGSRIDHVAFATKDAEALRKYLSAKGVKVPAKCGDAFGGGLEFATTDPEGNAVEFVQRAPQNPLPPASHAPVSTRLIHAGIVVHDPAAEDSFYRDILGFHIYWKGGMKEGTTDWMSMQVPDGTEWIEYMLNVGPQASAEQRGVMNHIALGVKDIQAADRALKTTGWTPTKREQPQLGRDGKWQLNLYDGDQTRTEFMEFQPVGKPCCSPYSGPHPH